MDLIAQETPWGGYELRDPLDASVKITDIPPSALAREQVIELLGELGINVHVKKCDLDTWLASEVAGGM